MNVLRQALVLREAKDLFGVFDDFPWYISPHQWTSVLTDAGSASISAGAAGGVLALANSDGTVADNDLEDLQKKAARVGGNVALMTPERKAKGGYFGLQDYMNADVYRCGGRAAR